MQLNSQSRVILLPVFVGTLLLAASASFAAALSSEKAVVIPATPTAFIPPPMFGDLSGVNPPPPPPPTGKTGGFLNFGGTAPPPGPTGGSLQIGCGSPGHPACGGTASLKLPVVTSYGPSKIGENESPLPQDRAFLTYNYYSEVLHSDFHREILGIEKTILGGDASIGLRLPFSEFKGDSQINDPVLIYKQKLLHNGDFTLSGGLAVTIPVHPYYPQDGRSGKYIPLLQPYVGYLWQHGSFFVQGFSSVAVPTNDVLPVILFNDIGIGWNIECKGLIKMVVPTFEVHVNTPLNHRDHGDLEHRRDSVDLTTGVHLKLGEKTWLGLGVGTTVTNPRLFNVEALASLNWSF